MQVATGKGVIEGTGGRNPDPKYFPSHVILLEINARGY